MKEKDVKYLGVFKFDPESYTEYTDLVKDRELVFANEEVVIYKY